MPRQEPPKMTKIKILQANVNRSLGAQDIARALGGKLDCSFICLQEPNRKSVLRGSAHLYASTKPESNAVIFKNKTSVIPILSFMAENSFIYIQCSSLCLYSVYISPNCNRDQYETQVIELFAHIRMTMAANKLPTIVCGDFNAKNQLWGGTVTDHRGDLLLKAASAVGMSPLNDGVHPTLIRHNGQSFIDVTLVSQELVGASWEVLCDEESLSDHRPILIEIQTKDKGQSIIKSIKKANSKDFVKNLEKVADEYWGGNLEQTIGRIEEAHRRSKKPFRADPSAALPYWWGDDVEAQIVLTRTTRRRLQRARNEGDRERLREEYINSRRTLTNLIRRKKKEKWRNLCQALNNNVYGDAYNIVRAQLKCKGPKVTLSESEKRRVFCELFETEPQNHVYEILDGDSPNVTEAELMRAVNHIKIGTAPGPDGITPEQARAAIMAHKDLFRDIYSGCIRSGYFPSKWKLSRLVLIQKPTINDERKYRPICLLDVLGKVLESIINERLKEEIEQSGGFNENQFGFRSGRSTMDAMEKLVEAVKNKDGKIVTAIFIDVKNAFNTAGWSLILRKARWLNISPGLRNILSSYFSERRVSLGPTGTENGVYAGVPQGSVLGPTLWNLLYDDVMRSCDHIGGGVELICYADDLTAIIKAKTVSETIDMGNRALAAIKNWMNVNELQMAPEKTAAVVFSWSYKHRAEVKFEIDGIEINPSKSVKYLGVIMDFRLSFTRHVDELGRKAEMMIQTLNILLANTSGPVASKRKVLAGALQSALTYAAPIWAVALHTAKNKEKLKSIQRTILLRCCSAYCTVSADAAAVLTGMVPIDLLIDERTRTREKIKENLLPSEEIKREEREATLAIWQQQWTRGSNDRASWTRSILRDIREWINRKHGEVDYHLTQALTGHGCFGKYLHRIKKVASPNCICGENIDDSEHTLFKCPRFHALRIRMELQLGYSVGKHNLITTMLRSREEWNHVHCFIRDVLTLKEKEERRMQQQRAA